MPQEKIDLHMHSSASDGMLSPARLIHFASECGVTVAALTDHDTVLGNDEAAAAAAALGIRFIAGVESSCKWGGKTIHIVGLQVDPHSEEMVAVSGRLAAVREARGLEMAERLTALGLGSGLYEAAVAKADGRKNLSRNHFAHALVDMGAVKNVQEAFDRWLGDGCPGYVPAGWPPLEEAVARIIRAGGFPVLAHPGRYRFRDDWMLDELVKAFRDAGGIGIEVISGSQPARFTGRCVAWAEKYGLLASAGSDFHNPSGMRPLPGAQGWVPAGLPTVLERLGIELPGQ